MKNWLRVTISVMLIVSVLAMSLSVYAVSPEYDISEELTNEDWILFIYYVLRSWGINITVDEIDGYSELISAWLKEAIQEYLSSLPSLITFNQWVFPWVGGITQGGVFQGNQTFLEDIQDFAEWLVVNYAIISDTTEIVQSGMHYLVDDNGYKYYAPEQGQITLLGTPIGTFYKQSEYEYYEETEPISFYNGQLLVKVGNQTTYTGNRWWYYLWIMKSFDGGQTWSRTSTGWGNNVNKCSIGFFYWPGDNAHEEGVYLYSRTNTALNESVTFQYVFNYLMQNPLQDASIVIVTSTIDVPDDPSTDIAIIDGEPQYIEINFPEKIDVNNLPAVVSTESLDNPHLEEAYRPIQGLISYAKDGVGLCMALLYEMPDEVVYMWYGLIASIVVWGMIKLMREH